MQALARESVAVPTCGGRTRIPPDVDTDAPPPLFCTRAQQATTWIGLRVVRLRSVCWAFAPQKYRSHIDASHSRQPLVKGERLVRSEVNAVMHRLKRAWRNGEFCVLRDQFPVCALGAVWSSPQSPSRHSVTCASMRCDVVPMAWVYALAWRRRSRHMTTILQGARRAHPCAPVSLHPCGRGNSATSDA